MIFWSDCKLKYFEPQCVSRSKEVAEKATKSVLVFAGLSRTTKLKMKTFDYHICAAKIHIHMVTYI